MRLSKQYKSKLMKRVLQTLGSMLLIALTLTIFKLADFSMLNNAVTTISGRQDYIKAGEKYKINFTDDSTGKPLSKDYTWTSYDEEVAEVNSETGIITAKSEGQATIIAENKVDGTQKRGTVNVYSNNSNAITVPQVEEGDGWTVVLKEDGTVWASGVNDVGQLGQGDTVNKNMPVQVKIDAGTYLTNVVKISVSYAQGMALTADGEVYAWGRNNFGQLGVGDTTNRTYATKVKGMNGEGYLGNIVDISMGYSIAFAVNENGDLFGWGYGNLNWLLGEATTYTPVKITKMSNVESVTTEYDSAGVILSNGETWVWGDNYYGALGNSSTSNGIPEAICLGNDIKEISFGGHSGYILKKDGTVWSSGYNNYGQLGVGDTTNRTTFTQVVLADGTEAKAKTIKAGTRNLQFIGEDGKVYVTGYNGYGQLCDGTTTNTNYPIVMKNEDGTEVTDAISLIVGMHIDSSNPTPRNMGIVRKDGTVWLAGDNTWGQIGNETTNASNVLTQYGINVGELNVRQKYIKIEESFDIDVKTASSFNVFMEQVNQEDFTWESYNEDVATVNNNGTVTGKTVGYTTIIAKSKTTGIEARAIIYVTNKGDNVITVPQAISTSNGTMLVLKENGEVWGSGVNTSSELAQGDTTNKAESVRIKTDENTYLENIIQIQAGEASSYALDKDGNVFAWGANAYGQLGLGDTTNRTYATKVTSIPGFKEMPKVVQISGGYHHFQILLENGEVYSCRR